MPKALPLIDTSAPICCSPVAAAPMGEDDALEVALRLKALADPVRVRLMSLLLAAGEGCTCDLAAAPGGEGGVPVCRGAGGGAPRREGHPPPVGDEEGRAAQRGGAARKKRLLP